MVVLMQTVGCEGDDESGVEQWVWSSSTDFGRQPIWSPDGEMILFGDDRPGNHGLFLWTLTPGALPELLGDGLPPHNWDYQWSPDGARICFSSPGEIGDPDVGIWVVTVSDGSAERIYDRGHDISWKYSGDAVVARIDNHPQGEPGIYQIDIGDYSATRIATGGYQPLCCPTSNWVAFRTGEIRGLLQVRSGEGFSYTFSDTGLVQMKWSANGQYLCAVFNDYITGEIRGVMYRIRVHPDGLSADSLTRWAAYPAPDRSGESIAFLRMSNSRWVGLWLHTIGGSETRIAPYGFNPSFDPTGNRIAVNAPEGGIRILYNQAG